MISGRGKHVHDAAAHRHIPATGHHVLAHVRELRQFHQQIGRVQLGPLGQLHRLPASGHRRDGLHHRSRRRHHDPRSASGHHGTEHLQAVTDRVRSRRQTLVGQRLPARELRHLVVVDPRQFVGQLLTFPLGGGDHQQRRLLRERRDQERAQRLRRAHHRGIPVQPVPQLGQGRVLQHRPRQTGQGGGRARGGGVRGGGGGGHACSASG